MTYKEVFAQATGNKPYPYQSELAESASMHTLLNVPTGAGKTRRQFSAGCTEDFTILPRMCSMPRLADWSIVSR